MVLPTCCYGVSVVLGSVCCGYAADSTGSDHGEDAPPSSPSYQWSEATQVCTVQVIPAVLIYWP